MSKFEYSLVLSHCIYSFSLAKLKSCLLQERTELANRQLLEQRSLKEQLEVCCTTLCWDRLKFPASDDTM